MKKTLLLAALVLLGWSGAAAQDTVVSDTLKGTYFHNNWISCNAVTVTAFPQFETGQLTGKYFYTKDSLTVYGIAAALRTYDTTAYYYPPVQTTSMDNVFEHLGLLVPEADTLRWVSDSLLVHLRDTPVSYYYDVNLPNPSPVVVNKPQSVYEVYFDSPVRVADSFYVGITQQSWKREYEYTDTTGRYVGPDIQLPVLISGYSPFYGGSSHPVQGQVVHKFIWEGEVEYAYFKDSVPGHMLNHDPFLFPIMVSPYSDTADADTTVVDTTGIASPQLLGRYVSVVPNPAADKAQVLSSFGLREVEVYDAGGVCVLRRRLTGYTADLDVSALPAGAYLVRVATLSGTVTKKLVVQRR